MNTTKNIQRGDLILISFSNWLAPAVFLKETPVSMQYYNINEWVINRLKDKGKCPVTYINATKNRYVKVNEDILEKTELNIYKEIKNLI